MEVALNSMLDFTIDKEIDRVRYIERELEKKPNPSNTELDLMANYILYGKDEEGQSVVDKGLVEIDTKYASYKKKSAESLDELQESVTFNEVEVKPFTTRQIYKNPKPTIDKDLPELVPLLDAIDRWEHVYKVATGKEKDPLIEKKSKTEIYKLKHFLVSLKRQQYDVYKAWKGMAFPYTSAQASSFNLEDPSIEVLPLGLKIGDSTKFLNPKEDKASTTFSSNPSTPTIDFRDPTHIYRVLDFYSTLYEKSLDDPYSNTKYLIETLDFYISITPLDGARATILNLKKHKFSNKQIASKLKKDFNLSYNENYISTIYTKEICGKIANAVKLHYDYWLARDDDSKWKKCSCCGEWRLRDSRDFVHKVSSLDGYSNRCKRCDREKKKKIALKVDTKSAVGGDVYVTEKNV